MRCKEFNDELILRTSWFEIRFQMTAVEGGSVPRFLGPVLHGAFGHALQQACETFPDASEINHLCYSGETSDGRLSSDNYISASFKQISRVETHSWLGQD